MNLYLMSLQFFSKIPIKKEFDYDKTPFHKSIIALPFVGLTIAFLEFLIFYISIFFANQEIASILAVLTPIFLTGAFHLDGLADTFDGFSASSDKEKILVVMRDSRLGTSGVIAVVFSIVIKIAVLNTLTYDMAVRAIFYYNIIGKSLMPICLYKTKYPRDTGMGQILIGKTSLGRTVFTILTGFVLSFIIFELNYILLQFFIFIISISLKQIFIKKIDGITGDTLGAFVELIEIFALLGLLFL